MVPLFIQKTVIKTVIKFIIQDQSAYVYRGDDSYLLGEPIGVPLQQVDVRIRAQNAYEHVKDTNRKTDQYTSFSLNKRLANKFTKRDQVIKIAWEALHQLEVEGQIKILYPEDVTQLIYNHGKKKFKRQASAIRDIMTKNHEILIEGENPYRYEKEIIIQLAA